jgi:beta-glucosidase
VSTDVTLEHSGRHVVEVGPVGAHRITVDGELQSVSDRHVGVEVVLDSSYSNPQAVETVIDVDAPRTARVTAEVQVIDGESYGRFVRLHFRYRAPGPSIDEELDEAVAAAVASDLAIVVVGTNPETESEGWDRPGLSLPGRQDELVRRIAAANPRTVVVVNAGAPVLLPWLDDVPAVLWWWLPGQEAGRSLAAVLTGAIEPSGRLPWTLPAREEDVPVPHGTPVDGIIDYTEGLDVGHRGWDRLGRTPAREFGYGLGYSRWEYRSLELIEPQTDGSAVRAGSAAGPLVVARVEIANAGDRDSREIVQVYLSTPDDASRPVTWLAGFTVADVPAGASATVDIPLERRSFESWSTDDERWTLRPATYRVRVGRSSRDLRLEATHPVGG